MTCNDPHRLEWTCPTRHKHMEAVVPRDTNYCQGKGQPWAVSIQTALDRSHHSMQHEDILIMELLLALWLSFRDCLLPWDLQTMLAATMILGEYWKSYHQHIGRILDTGLSCARPWHQQSGNHLYESEYVFVSGTARTYMCFCNGCPRMWTIRLISNVVLLCMWCWSA